jgi:hypothetical protein
MSDRETESRLGKEADYRYEWLKPHLEYLERGYVDAWKLPNIDSQKREECWQGLQACIRLQNNVPAQG